MSTFGQWWTTFNKNGKVHEHYWLCGVEDVLVDEVIGLVQRKHEASQWNSQTFIVGVHEETDIWQSLFSDSIDSNNAFTIVRGVDKLESVQLIQKLIQTKLPNHVVVFVSNKPKVERVQIELEDGTRKQILPDYLEGFEKKGKVVECIPFTQSSAKTAVAWIKTKVEAKDGALVHLLNASGGDLILVRDTIQKLRWLQEPATIRNVNHFVAQHPDAEFAEALISLDKEVALRAIAKLSDAGSLQLIGHLDAQVDLAGRIHDMMSERKTVPQIMKLVGGQAFLVPALSKSAKYYTKDRRLSIRVLISEVDKRLRKGTRDGVLESLVMLW